MASAYGNVVNRWQSYIEASITSQTDTTATITLRVYFHSISYGYKVRANADGTINGVKSAVANFSATSGTGQTVNQLAVTHTVTVNKGSSAQNIPVSGRVQLTGGFHNGTSTAYTTVTVPAITYSAPNAPSNCSASRASDTQATVTWSNGSTSTTQPRTDVLVERQTDTGSWVQVASLSASATNYTDNGISADHRYAYRVRSKGNGGTSGYSTSGYIYTTPAAPSSVTAAKASASSVTLSAEGLPAWAEGYEISRTADGGGSWQAVGTAGTFPWTDASAPAGTIRYRVRSYRGDLYSAYVESNSITTITPPLAPTVQALPSVVATGSTVTVQWTPNHPDGSAQTQAQVEYTVGSGSPQTATVQGAGTSYRLPASATSSAGTVSVRVRTHGLDDEWGAWSAAQTVRVAVPPSVSITVPPVDGARVGSLPLTVEWDASDATGVSSQSIALLDSAGSTLYSASLGASARELVLDESTYLLDNATDYSLRLTVRGGSSLTTTVARSFSTSFAEPARPDAGLSVDPSDLSAAVTVYAGSPSSETGEVIEVPATPGTLVPGFTVFGNTRQNLWANPATRTSNGVTLTANDDGSVTLSGTATANIWIIIKPLYFIRPSTTYTLSVSEAVSGGTATAAFYVSEFASDGIETPHKIGSGETSVTFTTKADCVNALCGLSAYSGSTVSGTYRIMLNEGSEAQPWCPPGINGVDELSVVCAGKNLIAASQDFDDVQPFNSELEDAGGGWVHVKPSGSVSGGVMMRSKSQRFIVGETYTLSFDARVDSGTGYIDYNYLMGVMSDGKNLAISAIDSASDLAATTEERRLYVTFTVSDDAVKDGYLMIGAGDIGAGFYVRNVQLELGSTATAYELPAAITQTSIDLDGHALNSLPDGTRDELRIDGTGAVTLVQRVGVTTAPTSEGSWTWGASYLNASFVVTPDSVSGYSPDNMRCDKLPPKPKGQYAGEGTYSTVDDALAYARISTADTLAELVSIAGGATYLYKLATPQEVDLPGIAMPAFPAAETQVFCASNVPCEVRVDYPATESFTVQRALPDGSRHTIATGLTEGQQALDRLPPLNVDFTYLVTAYAETGVSSTQELPAHVDSGGMEAFNFGQGASVALLMGYNATGSESADHGGTLYDFATGDGSLPLFYPTGALTGSASRSYAVTSREHANRVRALSREYPEAWFRDFDGNRMLCRASFSISLVQGSRDVRTIDVAMDECAFEEASNG